VTVGVDMDDEVEHQPRINLGQAGLKIVFAFIMMVASASYTANLAAMLVKPHIELGTITSIDDCVEKNCVSPSTASKAQEVPRLTYSTVPRTCAYTSTGWTFWSVRTPPFRRP
jgi:hypothetical protein